MFLSAKFYASARGVTSDEFATGRTEVICPRGATRFRWPAGHPLGVHLEELIAGDGRQKAFRFEPPTLWGIKQSLDLWMAVVDNSRDANGDRRRACELKANGHKLGPDGITVVMVFGVLHKG